MGAKVFNCVGIDAIGSANEDIFKNLRPSGTIRFEHDLENEYDPFCVKVIYEDEVIGFVPGKKVGREYVGSYLQKYIIDNNITHAMVDNYSYYDSDTDTWNDEHKGILKHVRVVIPEDNESGFSSGSVIGGRYVRVTTFIKFFDYFAASKENHLLKWAYGIADNYDDYEVQMEKICNDGTDMHKSIERALETRNMDNVPKGFINWHKKYEPEIVNMEVRVRNNELMVSGQYDLLAYVNYKGRRVLAIVDWKSSRAVRESHKFQVGIYASSVEYEGDKPEVAMVVAMGSDAKQGYSCTIIDREKIDNYYYAAKLLRKLIDTLGVYISEENYK